MHRANMQMLAALRARILNREETLMVGISAVNGDALTRLLLHLDAVPRRCGTALFEVL
jgi:hypothetical protein